MAQLVELVGSARFEDLLLEQLIGAGGMGKVFRAQWRTRGETVAVKALAKRHHHNPQAVSAFLQEAAVMSQLRHPGIVPLRGVGQFPGGGLFLVMDFVRGENLASRLSRGPFTQQEALRIVTRVLEALAAAHHRGVVHCDIKPANLLLDDKQRVYVTDFGFAQLIQADQRWGHVLPGITHARGGTPDFAAPEQLTAENATAPITPAADIYSVAKVLMALLLGSVPRTHAETRAALRHLPPRWGEICDICTRLDPAERYASADELLAAIS